MPLQGRRRAEVPAHVRSAAAQLDERPQPVSRQHEVAGHGHHRRVPCRGHGGHVDRERAVHGRVLRGPHVVLVPPGRRFRQVVPRHRRGGDAPAQLETCRRQVHATGSGAAEHQRRQPRARSGRRRRTLHPGIRTVTTAMTTQDPVVASANPHGVTSEVARAGSRDVRLDARGPPLGPSRASVRRCGPAPQRSAPGDRSSASTSTQPTTTSTRTGPPTP